MQEPDKLKIGAVVFDLDGLMLNTEDVFSIAGKQMLARRGMKMTDEIHQSMLGRRPNEAFQAMKDITGITDSIESLKLETRELFSSIADDHLSPMPGLFELLNVVDETGLPKAVATSSPRDYMENLLGRFDLLHRFAITLTAEDVTHGKPHPEIYLTAAARLNVHPHQMMVLEDSETGTRAGASAGAVVVSISNIHTSKGDFSMATLKTHRLDSDEVLNLLHQ